MFSISRKLAPLPSFVRGYPGKYPRPRPGTSERPPLKHRDTLLTSPNATVTNLEDEGLTFVHRPPPSAAAPESTTAAPSSPLFNFRRSATPADVRLPPLSRKPKQTEELKPLSEEDIQKMCHLRRTDPETYSLRKLAKMFGCSKGFVAMRVNIRTSQRRNLLEKMEEEHASARERWSERHQLVQAIRVKRREMW